MAFRGSYETRKNGECEELAMPIRLVLYDGCFELKMAEGVGGRC